MTPSVELRWHRRMSLGQPLSSGPRFRTRMPGTIVSRLLTTARPLGSSTIYGHGALDLEAALSPSGSFRFVLPGRKIVPVANTIVQVPPGFDVPDNSTYLADTIVYDEQMFPFRYDLGRHFLEADTGTTDSFAQWFLSSLNSGSTNLPMGRNASAHFTHDEAIPPITAARLFREDENRKSPSGAIFNIRTESGFRVSVGNANRSDGVFERLCRFANTSGPVFGRHVDQPVFDHCGFWIGLERRLEVEQGYRPRHRRHARIRVFRFGQIAFDFVGRYPQSRREHNTRCAIRNSAGRGFAYGDQDCGSSEQHCEVDHAFRRCQRERAYRRTSHTVWRHEPRRCRQIPGCAEFPGFQLGEKSGEHRFVFGSEIDRIWSASDQLILTVSLPFRARGAELTIDLPDKEIEDQVVQYTPRSISLAPRGREKRLQMTYEVGVTEGISLTAGGYARIQPDHDEEAGDEFGAAGKIQIAF